VGGRSAYGITGTRDVGEVYDEVAANADKLCGLLGHPVRLFRSGTAHYDDVATRIVGDLGEHVIGFDVNGDGGATFTPAGVARALRSVRPGSIVIGHMNHPGRGTAQGLRLALPLFLADGYRFVHVADHLQWGRACLPASRTAVVLQAALTPGVPARRSPLFACAMSGVRFPFARVLPRLRTVLLVLKIRVPHF
jgi:hypothetical protein